MLGTYHVQQSVILKIIYIYEYTTKYIYVILISEVPHRATMGNTLL